MFQCHKCAAGEKCVVNRPVCDGETVGLGSCGPEVAVCEKSTSFFDILLQNYFYYNCPSDSRRGVVLVACVCNFVTGKRKTRITRFRSGELCGMKSVSRCNRSTMSQTVCADAARHAVEINT